MFRKPSVKKTSQPVLNSEQLQNLMVELTEQKQTTISGGFPCDGPGRGGTCDTSGPDAVFFLL